MKVLFIPDYREGNPYQTALANSLVKCGAEVCFSTTLRLYSVLSSVKNHWKPDILHIHWPHPFLLASSRGKAIMKSVSFIGKLLLLKLFGIKIVWTVHNIVNLERKHRSIELFFNKLIARLCNKLIVHCPSAKNEVMSAYDVTRGSFIEVIPHGNYISSYENIVSKTQARELLQLSINDTIFIYFGLIRPYKGIPKLIDAFEGLNFPQANLLIVGKPYNDEIAKDIKKRCKDKNIKTIFKFIPDEKVQIYMNVADVVVYTCHTSFFSPTQMPGAVMLAMSFGKPVIAPAVGCISDILDEKGSFLYNASSERGLLEAMQRALNASAETLERMGEHNFELAKKLRWDDIAKRTYGVYQECLAKCLYI